MTVNTLDRLNDYLQPWYLSNINHLAIVKCMEAKRKFQLIQTLISNFRICKCTLIAYKRIAIDFIASFSTHKKIIT